MKSEFYPGKYGPLPEATPCNQSELIEPLEAAKGATMKCPKCGSDIEMMVDLTILCPAEMESQLSKKNLRKKEVKIYAANWERASYFCRNNKCCWTMRPDR